MVSRQAELSSPTPPGSPSHEMLESDAVLQIALLRVQLPLATVALNDAALASEEAVRGNPTSNGITTRFAKT